MSWYLRHALVFFLLTFMWVAAVLSDDGAVLFTAFGITCIVAARLIEVMLKDWLLKEKYGECEQPKLKGVTTDWDLHTAMFLLLIIVWIATVLSGDPFLLLPAVGATGIVAARLINC